MTSDNMISGQNQNIQLLFVERGVKFNIWELKLSAQFKFNNNVEQ